MKINTKKIQFPALTTLAMLFIARCAGAQATGITSPTPKVGTLYDFVVVILGILIKVSIPLLACFVVYAGYQFVTAQGDVKKITDARRGLYAAVIGTAIVLGAVVLATAIGGTIDEIL